jgi:hypothetical protein
MSKFRKFAARKFLRPQIEIFCGRKTEPLSGGLQGVQF